MMFAAVAHAVDEDVKVMMPLLAELLLHNSAHGTLTLTVEIPNLIVHLCASGGVQLMWNDWRWAETVAKNERLLLP
jgi:hypothetical protein